VQARSVQTILDSYDLISVRPTNEKAFLAACTQVRTDIISLDVSHRISFMLKLPTIRVALSRGVRFELCYGRAIQGLSGCSAVGFLVAVGGWVCVCFFLNTSFTDVS
jgi:RNase P/RNase MRP subunit p30